ncbi:Protein MAIN-LIKE 2 [Glycine max]|nr:Protein MAIN-LIKE 2 [Glycine max]
MDHADDEIHEQHEEIAADDVADAKGFSGEPHNTSVLQDYVYHVAAKERPEVKLSSHGRKVEKFGKPALGTSLVAATGLSPLITCSLDTRDQGLMSAFMERWHKETSTFRQSVGEVTITLDDVASLLHLPITGAFHTFEPLHMDDVMLLLVELHEVSVEEARAKTVQCHGAYVRLSWLQDVYRSKCDTVQWTLAAQAYLLHLLGCTLFVNKSATHVHMCCIYEHFPSIGSAVAAEDYERKPRTCHWKSGKTLLVLTYRRCLDRLMSNIFGYVQTISPHSAAPSLCIEDIDDRWIQFFEYIALVGQICVALGKCSLDYMDWFYLISHPFMSPAQPGDPPIHPSVQHHDTFVEQDVAQHLVAAMAMDEAPEDAHVDVEQPRHVVEACQAIVERLERLLNLRIVTEGIEATLSPKNARGSQEVSLHNEMSTFDRD